MNEIAETWLHLFVDAMTEKDPYKRLALVEQLRKMRKANPPDAAGAEPARKYYNQPAAALAYGPHKTARRGR